MFALRSAVVFALVWVPLHFLVSDLVEERFRESAEFHAGFVTDAVMKPLLRDLPLEADLDAPHPAAVADALTRDALDGEVVRITAWRADGVVVAADDRASIGTLAVNGVRTFDELTGQGPTSVLLAGGSGSASRDMLRTYVPFEAGIPLVAQIEQDWSPTLAASREFTRVLDVGLGAGLLVLWALLLPIVLRTSRRLHERSRIDELTGLANRTALEERIEHALTRRTPEGRGVGVVFIDVDGFKEINDTLGHAAGDDVLRVVADRLRKVTRAHDTVGRYAGDEFLIVLEDTDRGACIDAGRRLLDALREPIDALGGLRLSASLGLAVAEPETTDADGLLRQADAAMYRAKADGGDTCRLFDSALSAQLEQQRLLEHELPDAAERSELYLLYQPFFAFGGPGPDAPVAVEALARWTHPVIGAVPPSDFIPAAERNGSITAIGEWILREACATLRAWQEHLERDDALTVFVNLSAVQITEALPEQVDRCLADTGADPTRLGFEITETALLDEADDTAIEILGGLRARGCKLAIDDFGTGYSSLSRLRLLPLDLLKVDASFVKELCELCDGSRDRAIMSAVVGLAQELGMTVLAEGVETTEQLEAVRGLGFDLAQGYLLARPAPAAHLPPSFARHVSADAAEPAPGVARTSQRPPAAVPSATPAEAPAETRHGHVRATTLDRKLIG